MERKSEMPEGSREERAPSECPDDYNSGRYKRRPYHKKSFNAKSPAAPQEPEQGAEQQPQIHPQSSRNQHVSDEQPLSIQKTDAEIIHRPEE